LPNHPLQLTRRSGRLAVPLGSLGAGRRLYEVTATGASEELLARPEVRAFFDSLAVGG
jgi:hypothetical protein